ncbi:MAG TPA: hypothetical protein PLV77_05330 [Solirubrobacterales bacterium]|nr:hypothetical protein [Solirubrobacterales bacterium]
MNRLVPLLAVFFLSCAPLFGCTSSRTTEVSNGASANGVPQNLVLRSYEVPNNGAQRMRLDLESGKPIEEIYRETVAETAHSYAGP